MKSKIHEHSKNNFKTVSKKYIYSIIALGMVTLCSAQLTISQAEYFWDNDPGLGLGTAVSATDGSFNGVFEQLTKTGIATPGTGLHKFNIRIKDSAGMWGSTFTTVVQVNAAATPYISIVQAEYFWDADPGEGNGTAVLATDGNFNDVFEQLTKTGIALPANGLHVFNIRMKDSGGMWGSVFRSVVSVEAPLATEDFNLANLIVYPNPVKDILNFSSDKEITSAAIYNLMGQEVRTESLHVSEGSINVSNLASGTYLIKITANDAVKTLKFIKG
ncbi:T9SS type A sorting domain-containing protein [Flavobacterium enshiense]|uniref:T9SS type A sorting domain-containing protein n=1 Tax=Flavobacterium enshiense TaxID=1341165 RepID=UPI00345CD8DF